MRRSTRLAVLLGAAAAAASSKKKKPKKPVNVLWLLVDDLRPQLGAYGQRETKTPRLDALAREGVVFERAYCQLSVCAPSRNSFMTGRRPDSLRVYNFVDHFRSTTPDAIALPEFFRGKGYVTLGAGKTYQPGKPPAYDVGRSWSGELPYLPLMKNLTRCSRKNAKSGRFLDVCPEDFGEEAFMDRLTADYAVEAMGVARKLEKPFFVVAGFYRPHLRWHVPRAFYDRYSGTLGTPLRSRSKPSNMPDIAWANEGCHTMTTEEHGTVAVSMDRPLKRSMVAELRKGYLACASWIDELAGRVLDAADAVPSAKADTVVLLSSDHGFHLGEQASWTKHTLFEIGSRVPLVVRAPGVKPGRSRALVELTDVYRTFADLAGLPAPARDVQGKSLGPLLRSGAPHRNFSVTQYPRCPRDYRKQWDANCKRLTAAEIPVMGYTLRVDHFRFTEWYYWVAAPATRANERFDPPEKVVDKKRDPLATELYALDDARINDFDGLELANVAGDPRAACAVAALRAALAIFLACQHDAAGCDDRVGAAAYRGSTCVDATTRADLRRRPGDGAAF